MWQHFLCLEIPMCVGVKKEYFLLDLTLRVRFILEIRLIEIHHLGVNIAPGNSIYKEDYHGQILYDWSVGEAG